MAIPFHFQVAAITLVAPQRLVPLLQLFAHPCHNLCTLLAIMLHLLGIDADHVTAILHPNFLHLQWRRIAALFPRLIDLAIAALVGQHLLTHFVLLTHAYSQKVRRALALQFFYRVLGNHAPVGDDTDLADMETLPQTIYNG